MFNLFTRIQNDLQFYFSPQQINSFQLNGRPCIIACEDQLNTKRSPEKKWQIESKQRMDMGGNFIHRMPNK